MSRRPPAPDPIAYFLTWTTYGSWLPGDERGWVDRRGAFRDPNASVRAFAVRRLTSAGVSFSPHQRGVVARCVAAHARFRGWTLHAVQCRVQHVHVVVSASGCAPSDVIIEFKAWSTRALAAAEKGDTPHRWWTRGGSARKIYDERGLENVITYVRECQDWRRAD